jgi:flavodoxin
MERSMKALVVYDSHFGYTEKIARAIAAELAKTVEVDVVHVGDPGSHTVRGYDLVLVGGPTEGHGLTVPMREWLTRVGPDTLAGIGVAAFDTRLAWPKILSGSAASSIAPHLTEASGYLVVEPESFIVHGKENPDPDAAALEHVQTWVKQVLASMPMAIA